MVTDPVNSWKHAFLFVGGLCWVVLALLLILWDGKPRKEPIEPTVTANRVVTHD